MRPPPPADPAGPPGPRPSSQPCPPAPSVPRARVEDPAALTRRGPASGSDGNAGAPTVSQEDPPRGPRDPAAWPGALREGEDQAEAAP